jgi:hypothetical protein
MVWRVCSVVSLLILIGCSTSPARDTRRVLPLTVGDSICITPGVDRITSPKELRGTRVSDFRCPHKDMVLYCDGRSIICCRCVGPRK